MMEQQQNTNRVDFSLYEDSLIQHAETWTQSEVFAHECPAGIAIYS